MNDLFVTIIGVSVIVLIAGIVIYQYQFANGHHSVGDSQPENPHNPNNYTFTFSDMNHCSKRIVALVDGNLELCKELGWSEDSGEWGNPYLDNDNTNDGDFYSSKEKSNNSSIEEYVKKYCPEYSDETQLMVLCDYPEFEEPSDDSNR